MINVLKFIFAVILILFAIISFGIICIIFSGIFWDIRFLKPVEEIPDLILDKLYKS